MAELEHWAVDLLGDWNRCRYRMQTMVLAKLGFDDACWQMPLRADERRYFCGKVKEIFVTAKKFDLNANSLTAPIGTRAITV